VRRRTILILPMEQRKKEEIEYYDKRAEKWLKKDFKKSEESDFERFKPPDLSSYQFCYQRLRERSQNKKVLDYGCGNGVHTVFLAKSGAKVIGIDLSEKSLEIAKKMAKKEGVEKEVEFLKMDCEKMNFPDNFFDLIFDGGTFSSLDLKKIFPGLVRVLKPEGVLIGIETLGHNPLTNLKREINKIRKKRTKWAVSHILKIKDLKMAKNYFNKTEVYFFHLISWLAIPFLNFRAGKIFLNFLEAIDKILLKIPFFKKYAFKVVFIFSKPKINA